MDRKHNKKYQIIKKISKQNNLDYTEYLVNYFPRKNNKENNKAIVCIDREIDIPKRFEKELMSDEEKKILCKKTKDHLEKEIKEISKLSHKGITKIIDYFEEPENVFHILSENYQCDLDDFMKMQKRKNKYFSESLVLSFFTQICLAIKYIHDLNILHRNINPSNVILVSNKIVKLSNFDVSRILYTSNEKSITNVKNWNSYTSPEMGMNLPYSFKNDIWCLGILLFNMMALNCPFNNKQLVDIQNMKKVDKVYLYNKLPKHFSNDIKILCIDLLKAYPAERPDINSILNNYRIVKNEILKVEKVLGGNLIKIDNIKNLYRTDLNFKQKIEAKNKSKNKNNRISSIYAQLLKRDNSNITNKDGNKINENKKENEDLKISVYDNIKEKIMDPMNVMGRDMVYGQIINDRDSQDFTLNNNNGTSVLNKNNSNNFNK